jgi:uncharacterized protein YdeI (YjbR/CyaY-like superfamily)
MNPVFFASPGRWRQWLSRHHARETEVWVGFHKAATGKPSISWPEAVDEALCFGWIDGVRRSIDATCYVIRFTPRRPGSKWSAVNVRRVAVLDSEGRMQPAGRRAFQAWNGRSSGYSYEERERARFTPVQEKAFRADRQAWAYFQAQAPWYRRTATFWVVSAKKEATRERRLAALIAASAAGEPIGPLNRKPPAGER